MDRDRVGAATVVFLFVVFAGIAASQRYTVPDPWKPYASAVQQFMAEGVRGDSAALVRRSAGAQPVGWVLGAARRQPAIVSGWAHELKAATGNTPRRYRGRVTVGR